MWDDLDDDDPLFSRNFSAGRNGGGGDSPFVTPAIVIPQAFRHSGSERDRAIAGKTPSSVRKAQQRDFNA